MTDSNIINFGDGPLTAQQHLALKKIRRDLQRMNLAYNDTQNLARVIYDLIGILLPGLDLDDEQDTSQKASV